jgi:histidinol-phosphate phosphatase family protein
MIEWFSDTSYDGRPAVFFDRDGVINEHIADGYVLSQSDFKWLPGTIRSMQRLIAGGRSIFIVSNQSCVNARLLPRDVLASIMTKMVETLSEAGVPITAWLCCPHRRDERCGCRKPGTAMLERAAAVTGVSLRNAVLIGDSASDIEAAECVEMRGILIGRNSSPALAAAVDDILR